jgi:hypothetical protein
MEQYQKTEHEISKLLHYQFNGGIVTKKANLDLSDTSKVYSTLKQLQEDLFITKKNRIFYTIKDYFNNIGFLGGNYGDYRFKSNIWA